MGRILRGFGYFLGIVGIIVGIIFLPLGIVSIIGSIIFIWAIKKSGQVSSMQKSLKNIERKQIDADYLYGHNNNKQIKK
jgi:uncharacterized membrane protein